MDHGEYECPNPDCSGDTIEARVAREVYGCDAGRHCTEPTSAQRVTFDSEIAKRLEARRRTNPEIR